MKGSDQEIYEKAVDLHATDDVDVLTVSVDRIDGGAWVSALVWVPEEEMVEKRSKPGCPSCGRNNHIRVGVRASADVAITWDEDNPHVETVDWDAATNIEMEEAFSFVCDYCNYYTTVENDRELFEKLGLETS